MTQSKFPSEIHPSVPQLESKSKHAVLERKQAFVMSWRAMRLRPKTGVVPPNVTILFILSYVLTLRNSE